MPNKKDNINDERAVRLLKMQDFLNANINPYPAKTERRHSISEAFAVTEGKSTIIAGRIMAKREMGKLTFCHVQDESGKMQVVLKQDEIGKEQYNFFVKKIDIGDILECSGKRFVTKKGEDSILAQTWTILAKAIRPLPDKFHGLSDEEIRFRKRYLDLLVNPELKEMFRRKALFWESIRAFLLKESFLFVETPVFEMTSGGADATPFVTHHNAMGIDVYLRISMGELWHKRLMVAGFEKTFEIGRQFRNEGMSREHLQEYAQMEFYWAYADYTMGMRLVERMYKQVIEKTFGTLQFDIGEFVNIDLSGKWEEIDYIKIIEEKTGVKVLEASEEELKAGLDKLDIIHEKGHGEGRLIDSLWKYCRKSIKGPAFLVNAPVSVSPLAKRKVENPDLVERYQIIIAGSELGNGYSELNDPVDQQKRFEAQAKLREAGDSEAQMYDADFVEALEHGMPPTTGFGMSERVFAFLENKSVRECVLFPLMKPENV